MDRTRSIDIPPRSLSPVKQSLLEKRLRGAFKPNGNGCSHHAREPGAALVPLQSSGSKPPFILIHGAGGGLLWGYKNLAIELGADQPVYAMEPRAIPNWPELKTVEDLAAAYVTELRAFQPRGPYYLGGYCFGGLLAYELARQLWVRCEAVGAVILLDAAAPNGIYRQLPWWRPGFLFNFVRNCYYWTKDFRELDANSRRNFLQRKIGVAGRKLLRGLRAPEREPDLLDLEEFIDTSRFPREELRLWQNHLKAEISYVPKRYPGPVALVRTRGQPILCSFDPQFGWGQLAAGGVTVKVITGTHEHIFERPDLTCLAEAVRGCLSHASHTQTHQSP